MNKTIVAIIFLSTTNQLFFVKLVLIFRGGGRAQQMNHAKGGVH